MANALRLYRAVVVSTKDPEGRGRIQLSIPRTVRKSAVQTEGWAAVAALPLGVAELRPVYAVGDSVLYAAERLPFAGAIVVCRETAGATQSNTQTLALELGQGNEMKIEAGNGAIQLSTTAGQQITLRPNGTVEVTGIDITLRSSRLNIASSLVRVDSGIVQCSGTVQCDTLISNSVVSASYTPGAGNIW